MNNVEDFEVDNWKRELDVGLTAGILMVKHVLPHMKSGGIILNIASDLSVIAPDQRIYSDLPRGENGKPFVKPLSYSIVKTGIVGMTRYT